MGKRPGSGGISDGGSQLSSGGHGVGVQTPAESLSGLPRSPLPCLNCQGRRMALSASRCRGGCAGDGAGGREIIEH
jgi:hypothetical protein